MNGLKKRFVCVASALLLAFSSLLSHSVTVHAAAVPVVPSAGSAEALMALLDLLLNALIVGGAAESAADYDSDMDLLDAFLKFSQDLTAPVPEMKFILEDGTTITLDDLATGVEEGTFSLPNEQQWGQYRVGFGDDFASILEAWEQRGGGTGDGGEPPEPKDPEFSLLQIFSINSGFLAMMGDFFLDLFNGSITGIDPDVYFAPGFTGQVRTDGVNQLYDLKIVFIGGRVSEVVDYSHLGYFAGYIDSSNRLSIYSTVSHNNSLQWGPCPGYSGSATYPVYMGVSEVYTDIPMFASYDEAREYLKTMDGSAALNRLCYDYPALVSSIPRVLAPLAGLELAPSSLQKTYSGMKTAYETEIKPQPKTDVATDTGTYTDTMTGTIVDIMPGITPAPSPDPDPEKPGTGTDTDTDTDDTIKKYKRDLRSVFPFCLPFDLISLFQVLDAEAVTPVFEIPFAVPALGIEEKVVLDFSFLDDFMVVFRTCETISFIIMLIFATHKMIKW